ncbi:hypothetical protein [Nonomuraea sp. NPDC049400]|uniref:hypothetical protein n=1 Tax=Nonomuraea sp. NPDC049400 TaxID=3364352 RepID=UPI00378CEF6A
MDHIAHGVLIGLHQAGMSSRLNADASTPRTALATTPAMARMMAAAMAIRMANPRSGGRS